MRLKIGLFLTCMAMSVIAHATTMISLDVESLARHSAAVVRGKVTSSKARWTADRTRIVTDTQIDVSESWKGAAPKTITVMQSGGEVGEIGQRVEGMASFAVGEDVVLFLEARGDRFTVTGLAQGRFRVEQSSDGTATFVRQDQIGDLLMVDSVTHTNVTVNPLNLPLASLKKRVQATLELPNAGPPSTQPTITPSRVP